MSRAIWGLVLVNTVLGLPGACAEATRYQNRPPERHAFCASSVRGKFDGRRRGEVAVVGSRRRSCRGPWQVLLRLANGRTVKRSLDRDVLPGLEEDHVCELAGCRVFGARDLDRDGRDELEIADNAPATGVVVAVYQLAGGSIRMLNVRARRGRRPAPMELLYLAGGTESSWVVCRDSPRGRQIVQVGEGHLADHHPRVDVSETSYALKGLLFRHVSDRTYSRRGATGFPLRVPGRPC